MHNKIIIVVGITILFLGTYITPSTAFDNVKDSSMPVSNGNTLYVGGNGAGNYTKIQDAINDAVDGDTVFVYNYSSPYFESVVIDKSICLVGENKYSTVIDVQYLVLYAVSIEADNVWLGGFTVQNAN
jgi:hypothetical protein